MERFLKRKFSSSQINESGCSSDNMSTNISQKSSSSKSLPKEVDLDNLSYDPGERMKISDYHPNQRDEIRRIYWMKGPCQPRGHDFPQTEFGKKKRRFNPKWFDQYPKWLEYSIKKNKAYCLCCYLCRDYYENKCGSDAFVTKGFSSWNKSERLATHVGDVNSHHNQALRRCEDLMKQSQSIEVAFHGQLESMKNEYRICLNASISVCRFLLRLKLPFHGYDETEESDNRGTFLELLMYTAEQNETVGRVILQNAPRNFQMISPSIQKDIVYCFAKEIINEILEDINEDVFSLLVDECSDISNKEQMVVVLRYVDKKGFVQERFIGIVHVKETSAITLKDAIDNLFAELGLSWSRVRGQGYDGASNIQGEFKGLKTLILNENQSAYYVHCFAHQLQLALVAVAKINLDVQDFFSMISTLLNVVGASCKHRDMILEDYMERIKEGIAFGEIETGSGLNQDLCLIRSEDTRWRSHYKSLLNVVKLYPSITKVLEFVRDEAKETLNQAQARGVLRYFGSFDFAFNLHIMLDVLGMTHELSLALQRKDQDILNALSLVDVAKQRLQKLRDEGWEPLLSTISSFCNEHDIPLINMDEKYVDPNQPRQRTNKTNLERYHMELFYVIIDQQLAALNDRFNEVNSELLHCVACLSPRGSFRDFNVAKLVRLSQFYPNDFSHIHSKELENQLKTYIMNIKADVRFTDLNGLADLSKVLVETEKHHTFPLVYQLLKLALVLPVATASVERCFTAMNLVKAYLRNRISDGFLNDCLVSYVEKEMLQRVTNESVIDRFQKMKTTVVEL